MREIYTKDKQYRIYEAKIASAPGKEWRVGFRDTDHTIYHVVAIAATLDEARRKLRTHRAKPVRAKRSRKVKHTPRRRKDGPAGFKPGHVNVAINALLGHEWLVQDSWIRFREGVLMRDGDFYRVVTNDGLRFKGAKHPKKAIELWKEGIRAPDEQPQANQLWVSRRQANRGLQLLRVRKHGDPLTGGAYFIARLVLFDTARHKWTPVFHENGNGVQARKVRGTLDQLQSQYRREYDPTRSST
jgi:hypothetical protein